jgi:hypothetical protein
MRQLVLISAFIVSVSASIGAAEEVCAQPYNATSTQASFSITAAGTFQVLLASNSTRHGCTIYNLSTDMMWVYFGSGTATSGTSGNSIPLPAGGNLPCNSGVIVPSDEIQITSTSLSGATGVVISQ